METEDLHLPDRGTAERGLSPAFLLHAPGRYTIVTARDQEVPLTLAGYRLNIGCSYRVCVADPAREVRLVGYPTQLVERQGDSQVVTKHGVRYHTIPIRVKPVGVWEKVKHPGAYTSELEIEATLPDGRKVAASLPVVIQLSFTGKLVLLLIAWALGGMLWGLLESAVLKRNLETLTSPWTWAVGFLFALLSPALMIGRRFWELRRRVGELRQQFQARWSDAAVPVASNEESGEWDVEAT